MDVVRAADAAFEHAAVPHGDAAGGADVVHANGLGVAAEPSRLDVHDPACVDRDRVLRGARRMDGLVEAVRRPDLALQRRMIAKIVLVERLFDLDYDRPKPGFEPRAYLPGELIKRVRNADRDP